MKAKRIAILESRLGAQMAELVAGGRGGVPFHAPALAELPDLDAPARLFVFQTGVGTKALFAATDGLGLTEKFLKILSAATVAARGPKPAGALRSRGAKVTETRILQSALNQTLVASIGPVASAALREFEIKVGLESKPPKLGALMSALDKALS